MPPENRQELEDELVQLPTAIFTADDSLGWVYQFWQRDEKERINKSEVRIGANQLPSVTQLFTEDYMVLFLLHNTLGAWWTAKRNAEGKDHRLPAYEWTYLRLNDDGSPAAGNFDSWPKTARLLRVLDPCMGSGHFLTFAVPILARMREVEEGSTLTEAVCGVLAENLFGLELDARCSQIAAFNLALTAWRMVGRPVQLPAMNLACSGLGINASQDSWVSLAGDKDLARDTLSELYTTFQKAPTLGSLIDPTRVGRPLLIAKFEEVWPLLERALAAEQQNDESRELAIAAKGVLHAARILASKFTLVSTNVPYLGRGRQDDDLKEYCEEFYSDAKADLATCFIDRCVRFSMEGGSVALVTKQEPLYLSDFKDIRPRLLKNEQWDFVARLGPRAFETISGEIVNVALIGLTHQKPRAQHDFVGLNASDDKTPELKALALRVSPLLLTSQSNQLENPDAIVVLGSALGKTFLSSYANAWQGIATSDLPRFGRTFWEIPVVSEGWVFQQSVPERTGLYGGRENILFWEDGRGAITEVCQKGATFRGQAAWNRSGVVVGQMSSLPVCLYTGERFSNTVAVLIPYDGNDLLPIWEFCRSAEFARLLRRVNPKLNVDNGYISKVPFDLAKWRALVPESLGTGLPAPTSTDARQWIFPGDVVGAEHPLQVALARLVGYKWPRRTGSSFPGYPSLEADSIAAHSAADGILCLNSLSGEAPAADRLRSLLSQTFGPNWSASRLAELLGDCDSLELWLRDRCFAEHCDLFHNRPFVWHIWDGRKDGFHALVNYHKLAAPNGEGRKTLEKLIYTLLGDWISRQKAEVASGADGAEARLSAALHLYSELEKILKGEPPYDIFVRWKSIHEQAIGWEPDLNDGVRLNMRPWLMAKPYQPSKKDACILRVTPIKLPLGKDRGKEPDRNKGDFPWFAETRDRDNDIHLTLDQKRKARERKKA
jgi:hypothetical protein